MRQLTKQEALDLLLLLNSLVMLSSTSGIIAPDCLQEKLNTSVEVLSSILLTKENL